MSVDARAIMVSGPELNRRPAAVARRLVAGEKFVVGAEFGVRLGLRCDGEFGARRPKRRPRSSA